MENKDFLIALLTKDNVVLEIRKELNQLLCIIPELKKMIGFDHCHPHHHLDVWEHTLLSLNNSPNQFQTRLVLLLHDIGKPYSYQQVGDIKHYKGHAEKSAEMAQSILQRLGFEEPFIDSVTEMIKRHDTPLRENDIVERQNFAEELFQVQKCDALAHNPIYNQKRIAYINQMEILLGLSGKTEE